MKPPSRSQDSSTVPNEASAARDHLANERTFLAWLRTALGLAGLGLLIERLAITSSGTATLMAALACVGTGAGSLIYAIARYRRVARHLVDGTFPIANRGPLVVGIGALVLTAVAALYLYLAL